MQYFFRNNGFLCFMLCKCGSTKLYSMCCEIYHRDFSLVRSAEILMRSRYCAYAMHNADYVYETTLPSSRKGLNKNDILDWAVTNKWMGLEIIEATQNNVEFKAHYLDEKLDPQIHHEKSIFKFSDGKWFYADATYPEQ
jgi:SEC-C motif-containing protein